MKNILITGSTDGIGKITAIEFAKEGHNVFIHGRNPDKLNDCVNEIISVTNNKNIMGFIADFADIDSVKAMTKEIKSKVSHIDRLINNAGIFKTSQHLNKDGLDIRFVVNFIAPYLLTKELMPLIDKANDSRIINLSSAAQSEVIYPAMEGKIRVNVNEAYAQSKLALTMWSFWLAEKNKNTTVIAVNPGSLLNTKMANEAYGQHWSPAEKGSDILYDLTINDEYKQMSGKYYDNDRMDFATAHQDAYNKTAIDALISYAEGII